MKNVVAYGFHPDLKGNYFLTIKTSFMTIEKSELIEFITSLGENCGNSKKMEWYQGLLSDIEIAWPDDELYSQDYEDNQREADNILNQFDEE